METSLLERENNVTVTEFKWAGKLGPFKIKTSCNECDLTRSFLQNIIKEEFNGKNVIFEVKPWLDNFFYCLFRFTWHTPIIMINGRKFFQYSRKKQLFDRSKLVKKISNMIRN